MKSYTDLDQSKKLAEILPLESADMFWYRDAVTTEVNPRIMNYMQVPKLQSMYYSPCWSLTALLDVLPDEIIEDGDVFRNMFFHLKGKYIIQYPRLTTLWPSLLSVEADNPIDACVEIIVKLKESKLL